MSELSGARRMPRRLLLSWPAPLKDVKTAIRFLRANAKTYNIDPNRIGIWGSFAGAHLSGLVATTADAKEFENDKWPGQSSAVLAAVLWYVPTDLSDAPNNALYIENEFLGFSVSDPANAEKLKKANPITYVSGKTPPIMLVHGTEDKTVPIRSSEHFYDALVAAKVPATFLRIEGAGHSFGQVSSVPEVMAAVLAFFDRNLKAK